MEQNIKRLRIFAGPNGSGKTTLINLINEHILKKRTRMELGIIINADLIQEFLSARPLLHLENYKIFATNEEFKIHLNHSELFKKTKRVNHKKIYIKNNILVTKDIHVDSYLAAVILEFIRKKLLFSKKNFSYETVMSHPSRVDFMEEAKKNGYRTYLYFVGTETPEINISRVKARIQKGGHEVHEIKIRQRYYRSIDLLKSAIAIVDKSYIFDNSSELNLFATTLFGKISLSCNTIPVWFEKNILN